MVERQYLQQRLLQVQGVNYVEEVNDKIRQLDSKLAETKTLNKALKTIMK